MTAEVAHFLPIPKGVLLFRLRKKKVSSHFYYIWEGILTLMTEIILELCVPPVP